MVFGVVGLLLILLLIGGFVDELDRVLGQELQRSLAHALVQLVHCQEDLGSLTQVCPCALLPVILIVLNDAIVLRL